jgi:hypothetical protein
LGFKVVLWKKDAVKRWRTFVDDKLQGCVGEVDSVKRQRKFVDDELLNRGGEF